MMCEECHNHEAIFTVTLTSGEGVTRKRLCSECMKKMELNLGDGDIHSFLSSILSIFGSAQTDESPVCSGCGLRYSTFEKTGKLGCAQCYHDFSGKLTPMLKRIHGNTQHNGRTPRVFETPAADAPIIREDTVQETPTLTEKTPSVENLREELRKKMDQAVAEENFEDAAMYRDQLRALTEAGEVHEE